MPTLAGVLAWHEAVNERMQGLISKHPSAELLWIVRLGIEHEQQYQELLLTDIKHLFSCSALYSPYKQSAVQPLDHAYMLPTMAWLKGTSGVQEMGVSAHTSEFHFDSEAPRHSVYLNPYEIGRRLITNAEWQEFIADGGYDQYQWWLDAGWS